MLSCEQEEVQVLSAPVPLSKVIIRPSGEVTVYAAEGTALEDLINLDTFLELGLKPGMTITEVEALLGKPDVIDDDRGGRDVVYAYRTSTGRIEIVRQHVSSEGAEVDRWFLRIRPSFGKELVHPLILKYSPPRSGWAESILVLAGPEYSSVGKLEFHEGRLRLIWWLGAGA